MDPIFWMLLIGPLAGLLCAQVLFGSPSTRCKISSAEEEERANQLLKEALSQEQYEALNLGGICVESQIAGYRYRVDGQGTVTLFTKAGDSLCLCVAPYHVLPKADRVLTMLR